MDIEKAGHDGPLIIDAEWSAVDELPVMLGRHLVAPGHSRAYMEELR